MTIHKEINFENEICDHLATHGWLYAEGDAAKYDAARALYESAGFKNFGTRRGYY